MSAGAADAASEDSVLSLAVHLAEPELVRALYLLDLLSGPLDLVGRDRLDTMVSRVLAAQDGMDRDHEPGAFAARRAEALRLARADGAAVADRIRHAPRPYLLAEFPERIVAHARLLDPRPDRRQVRVAMAPDAGGSWTIDVAARDQAGLLAAVTEVFAELELDVLAALVTTWGDGAALETFVVAPRPGASIPAVETLETAVAGRLGGRIEAEALPEAEIAFDDAGSPWYTLCEVRHLDRPGLLATIASALSIAGASIHAADLETRGGRAVDRFSLTDRSGAKLGRDDKDAIRAALLDGSRGRGRLGRLLGR